MTLKEPKKKKLSLSPPEKNKEKFNAIKEFINGATYATRLNAPDPCIDRGLYPWEEPHVRKDVTRIFNVRLPEPYHLKLEFLSFRRHKSKHQICLDVLLKALDAQVEDIAKKDRSRKKAKKSTEAPSEVNG